MANETAPVPAPPTKKARGFLFFAAVAAGLLLLAGVLSTVLLALYARHLIIACTDTVPVALSRTDMAATDYEALVKRVSAFSSSLKESSEAPALVLNADDLNALIAGKSDPADRISDMLHISLEGEKIEGQVSLPLDKLKLPVLPSGRYFNAAAAFKVSLDNGVLIITADSIQFKGKPLPESLMSRLRNENLARDVYRHPKNAEMLRKLASIKIKDGLLSIEPRANR